METWFWESWKSHGGGGNDYWNPGWAGNLSVKVQWVLCDVTLRPDTWLSNCGLSGLRGSPSMYIRKQEATHDPPGHFQQLLILTRYNLHPQSTSHCYIWILTHLTRFL